jgi:hypothetical protein
VLLVITVLIVLVAISLRVGASHIPCPPPENVPVFSQYRQLGKPGKTIPGQVTVELSKPIFREGECVQVRVANGLDRPVSAYAWETGCTIVKLERRSLDGWKEAAGCATWSMDSHYFEREIGPGEVVDVALDPYDHHLRTYGVTLPAFGVGIYRAVFNKVTSPPFVVTP